MPEPSRVPADAADEAWHPLCRSEALRDGDRAVSFDVVVDGRPCRAFAIRYEGRVHAYLNRCTHVAMEMDWQPDQFFDDTGRWLLCATHGAYYDPATGACRGGPCRGGLLKIDADDIDGVVYWRARGPIRPVPNRTDDDRL
jgi:nitrite reductase/ring-hydroxylating ferredoxin subunit